MRVSTWAQVVKAIRTAGKVDLRLNTLEADMNAELQRVRAQYEPRIQRATASRDALADALEAFATAHRDEMESVGKGGGLVYRCLWGKVAFRVTPPKITYTTKKTEKVLVALKAAGLTWCIRTVEEPNKDLLLALDPATLKTVLCKRSGGEQFEVKPDYEEIERHG